MPAPDQAFFSVEALVAAHTLLRDMLDAGVTAAFIRVKDDADVLLATVPLEKPCGVVDAETGRLTLSIAGRDDSADASGYATYAEVCNGDGVVHLTLPAQSGASPTSGYLILNSTVIFATAPLDIISATVG